MGEKYIIKDGRVIRRRKVTKIRNEWDEADLGKAWKAFRKGETDEYGNPVKTNG